MDEQTQIEAPTSRPPESIDSVAAGKEHTSSTSAMMTLRLLREHSTSSVPTTTTTTTTKKTHHPKRATSATNSPVPSRESSPVRPPLKTNSSARPTGPGRSRKNSPQEISPSRSASTTSNPPSAAATQRVLSATSIPTLQAVVSEPTIRAPTPQKPIVTTEPREALRWPISPRLRSPPPLNKSSVVLQRKPDQEVLAINVQRSSPGEQQEGKQVSTDCESEDLLTPGMRTPVRGASGTTSTLETVQEISQPSSPALGLDGIVDNGLDGMSYFLTEQDNMIDSSFCKTIKAKQSLAANESGSESGGTKGEVQMRMTSAATPATSLRAGLPLTKSYTTGSAAAGRGKPSGEGSTRNMTVETETVSSIPQVAVGGGVVGIGPNGSLRAKPSSETIRPKKEKKKAARKAPSVTSGTASSKADIFEAKVASAVDEANSSDSEETFVYESNPPESDRPRRFHSRTPSATSMASQVDVRNGIRSVMDGGHSVAMKKSMKFANTYNINGPEIATGEDDGKGTARSNMGTGRGTTHHHHIGRWGRNGGNGHASLFDNESPFPIATKSKLVSNASRNSSRPTSPKIASTTRLLWNGKRSSQVSSSYDLEADDERTPLISTIRSGRSGRSRRPAPSSMRQLEHQASRQNRSLLNRFAACLVLSVMMLLVISGAVVFMFATTHPLTGVKVLALKNVLASEQELIFDMQVMARNPNLVAVTIESMDMLVFAKSKYAGIDSEWWKHPQIYAIGDRPQPRRPFRESLHKRDDDPEDPPVDDDPDTNPNLEIGHIFEFESPLIFEGSPFQRSHSTSLGEIRVSKPGNQTQPSGSERWGRVLQHEFDLIVRGSLRYNLPLSQNVTIVRVEGRVTVKPNAADQEPHTVHIMI